MVDSDNIKGIGILAIIVTILCLGIFFAYPIVKDFISDDNDDETGDGEGDEYDGVIVYPGFYDEVSAEINSNDYAGLEDKGWAKIDGVWMYCTGANYNVPGDILGMKFELFDADGKSMGIAVMTGDKLAKAFADFSLTNAGQISTGFVTDDYWDVYDFTLDGVDRPEATVVTFEIVVDLDGDLYKAAV